MKHDPRITAGTIPVPLSAMARHLAVTPGVARDILRFLPCRRVPGGRYDLTEVWHRMWGIRAVPVEAVEMMQAPLFDVAAVAEMAGVCTATIRRAGNDRCPRWNLPPHCDLGPRLRRYLPAHVEAWFQRQPLEPWLLPQRGPLRHTDGLVPRPIREVPDRKEGISEQTRK